MDIFVVANIESARDHLSLEMVPEIRLGFAVFSQKYVIKNNYVKQNKPEFESNIGKSLYQG